MGEPENPARNATAQGPGPADGSRDQSRDQGQHRGRDQSRDRGRDQDRDQEAGTGDGRQAGRPDDSQLQARDGDAVYRFIERFSSVLSEAGFPRMPARVFVALLTSDSGLLTAAEIAQLLHASPAAVSGGVRYLIQVGMVSTERDPGSRRHRYRLPDNVWHEIMAVRDRMFSRWARVLQDGIEVLGPGTPAGTRMADSARYFEFLQTEMYVLLDRWREREAAYHAAAGADQP
jgi:predicted transcriptional regulator